VRSGGREEEGAGGGWNQPRGPRKRTERPSQKEALKSFSFTAKSFSFTACGSGAAAGRAPLQSGDAALHERQRKVGTRLTPRSSFKARQGGRPAPRHAAGRPWRPWWGARCRGRQKLLRQAAQTGGGPVTARGGIIPMHTWRLGGHQHSASSTSHWSGARDWPGQNQRRWIIMADVPRRFGGWWADLRHSCPRWQRPRALCRTAANRATAQPCSSAASGRAPASYARSARPKESRAAPSVGRRARPTPARAPPRASGRPPVSPLSLTRAALAAGSRAASERAAHWLQAASTDCTELHRAVRPTAGRVRGFDLFGTRSPRFPIARQVTATNCHGPHRFETSRALYA